MTLYYKDFDNKTVVITGGASGLGKGTAKVFAKYDANIVLVDIDRTKLDIVRNEISQTGVKVSYYICDVTKENEVDETVDLIEREIGDIDILSKICSGVFFEVEKQGICMVGKKK